MPTLACPQCEAEIELEIYRDSDGDADNIYGARTFWSAEIMARDCDCPLSAAQEQRLIDRAVRECLEAGEE